MSITMFKAVKRTGKIYERVISKVHPTRIEYFRCNQLKKKITVQFEVRKTKKHTWCVNLKDAKLVIANWEAES